MTDRANRRGFFGAIAAALALPAFLRRGGAPGPAADAVVPDILDPDLDWDAVLDVLYQAHYIDPDRAHVRSWAQIMCIVNRGKARRPRPHPQRNLDDERELSMYARLVRYVHRNP